MAGTYSILYGEEGNPDTLALDWGWQVVGKWTRSSKEYYGSRWHYDGEMVFDEPLKIDICEGGEGGQALMCIDDKSEAHFILGKGKTIIKTHDECACRALLKHFGLEDWTDEFPPEKIKTMSPAELTAHRREKERLYGLKQKEMLNSTLGDGYNQPAEEYD